MRAIDGLVYRDGQIWSLIYVKKKLWNEQCNKLKSQMWIGRPFTQIFILLLLQDWEWAFFLTKLNLVHKLKRENGALQEADHPPSASSLSPPTYSSSSLPSPSMP